VVRLFTLLAALFLCLSCSAQGRVERGTLSSPALGVTKAYRIYLPDGYQAVGARFPVIYLLHGWGVTEDYWADQLGLASAADAMKLRAIVVMPDGDRSYYANSPRPVDYDQCMAQTAPAKNRNEKRAELCVRAARYEDYIVRDLVGHIDANYRTIAKRGARALSGESAGGYGAMLLAMRNKQMFSSVAAHSAFFSLRPGGPVIEFFGADPALWRPYDPSLLVATLSDGELALYVDCGLQDDVGFHDEATKFHELLAARGIAHDFELVPGRHDDDLWRERIKHSLRFHARHFDRIGTPR